VTREARQPSIRGVEVTSEEMERINELLEIQQGELEQMLKEKES